ncbi:hypothetical protein GCM10010405_10220 [Streptomyces macrosporus]|uniref:Uncharacterized protein n=1 Tax=Streptomyces macrosporus TaxID=44032 RepID=A0ABN3JG58_9ACTN
MEPSGIDRRYVEQQNRSVRPEGPGTAHDPGGVRARTAGDADEHGDRRAGGRAGHVPNGDPGCGHTTVEGAPL